MEAAAENIVDRRLWWSARRKRYNVAMIIAAPLSLVATLTVWWVFEDRLPCLEITGFSILAGFPLFLIGLALANICYLLGPLSERIVRPRNVTSFRAWVYRGRIGNLRSLGVRAGDPKSDCRAAGPLTLHGQIWATTYGG